MLGLTRLRHYNANFVGVFGATRHQHPRCDFYGILLWLLVGRYC